MVPMMKPVNELTAVEAARLMARRELTAEALVRACLERIAAREAVVGAWKFLDPERALAQARSLDGGPVRGLLHGLPVGVKDIIDTVDMPTEYGAAVYPGHRPAWDAACVAAVRAAGGIVMGKTVTTEFATYQPGKTSNPHNPLHTPGGSSSGSAAAVASGMVPLAFGTQTAGSVIRPAAFCGVVGYKPSHGLICRAGTKPLSETLDTLGVFARSVEDAALFVAALTGRGALQTDTAAIGTAPRIGFCRTYEWESAQPEARAAWESAARLLSRAGAGVTEMALPPDFAGLAAAQTEIMACETAGCLAHERLAHGDKLSARLKELMGQGLALAPERYDADLALAQRCRLQAQDLFADCDLLIAPSAPGEAPRGLAATGDPVFNRIWTLLGLPCVHLPFAQGPNGLPVGVQAIGPFGSDGRTLSAARWAHTALCGDD